MTTLAISAPQPNVGTITCAGLTRISSLLIGSNDPGQERCGSPRWKPPSGRQAPSQRTQNRHPKQATNMPPASTWPAKPRGTITRARTRDDVNFDSAFEARPGPVWTRIGHTHRPSAAPGDGQWRNGHLSHSGIASTERMFSLTVFECPRQDSNL